MTLGLAPNAVDDVNAPWGMLLNKIGAYVQGGDPKTVQLVTDPRAATWDDPKYGPYRLCKILGDSMPKWGTTFEPALGNSFGDEYGIFLGNIQIPPTNPADNKKAENARQDWQTNLLKIQTRKATIGDRWSAFDNRQSSLPPDRRMSFDEWYNEFEAPIIGSMQNVLKLKVQTYTSLLNKAGGGYALISQKINSFSQETATFQTVGEGTGKDKLERVYRYTVGDDLTGMGELR